MKTLKEFSCYLKMGQREGVTSSSFHVEITLLLQRMAWSKTHVQVGSQGGSHYRSREAA